MQKKKGISLIVLVITIIVMIILAGAVIISLNNSGIIEKSSSAVKLYNQDEVEHIAQIAWSEAYLNKQDLREGVKKGLINAGINPQDYGFVVTDKGVNITKGWLQDGLIITKGDQMLEIGDLFQYSAGVDDYTGAWKVLGAEDGNLLLMSTENVSSLTIYGLNGNETTTNYGLLNGIDRLNELCLPYKKGTGAVGARSIKIEDVDKLIEFDKKTNFLGKLSEYGNKVTYSWSNTENGKVDYTSTNGNSGTLTTKASDSFYYIDYNKMKCNKVVVNENKIPTLTCDAYHIYLSDISLSDKVTDLLFKGNDVYWIASHYTQTNTTSVYYGLYVITQKDLFLGRSIVFYSNGISGKEHTYNVRAVVKLSPDIRLLTKDNTLGWSYTI